MIRTLLDSEHPFIKGITLEELEREHFVRLRMPGTVPAVRRGRLRHARRQVPLSRGNPRLHAAGGVAARRPELGAKFPLEMIPPKNDDSMNSTFGHRDSVDRQTATVHIAATDAAHRGIANDDQVRLWNDRGSCLLVARIDDTVRPGVVCAPAVRWSKRGVGGRNVNALISERLTDAGGGPTFYNCLVEVERIGD